MMDFLRESWKFLTSPPIYPLYVGIAAGLVSVLGMTITGWMKKRRLQRLKEEERAKDPEILFLEGALDEDPARKPNPNYTYSQFMADVYNKGLSFDEIYEKCGGVFPKKGDEKPPGAGLHGPMGRGPDGIPGLFGYQGYQGAQGNQGVQVYRGPANYVNPPFEGPQGFQGRDGRCPDRMTELQAWYREQARELGVKRLVPPPPAPHTVIHKIFTRGRR